MMEARRIGCGLLWLALLAAPLAADDSVVMGRRGMVVSAHPLASQVGIKVLMEGGNAVDAAVSMAAALGVLEFEMSGLGGVGNMLIYSHGNAGPEIVNLDFRDTIASKARIELYDEKNKEVGVLASCVPGNVAGWHAALDRYGTLSWQKALQPAIDFAENGFPIAAREARFIEENEEHLRRFPSSARIFLPGGKPPRAGDLFLQKDLARTLRQLAEKGPEVFYKGELTDRFIAFSDRQGGVFTRQDFENYQVHWRPPARASYRDYEIVSASAPNFGPTVVETFNLLEGFDLGALDPASADFMHLVVESMKIAADDGMRFIGDPRFVDVPLDRLLSKEYARQARRGIDPRRASYVVQAPPASREMNNTTAYAVVDRHGNVVSAIQTLISAMGSRVVYGDTGVLFNNNMRKVRSTGPNKLEPGKTFGTPSAPTLVLRNGKPYIAIGGVGGPNIWQAIVVALAKLLDGGMELSQAIHSPRYSIGYGYMAVKKGLARDDTFEYRRLYVEPGMPESVRARLEALGHEVVEGYAGNVHALLVDPVSGVMKGMGDPRIHARAVAW